MTSVEKRHSGRRSGAHRKHSDGGYSDTSSGGSFLDETDREVSNLTDRAFRSLCIGDEAVYNDSDVCPSSPTTQRERQLAFSHSGQDWDTEDREQEALKEAAQDAFSLKVQQYGQDCIQGGQYGLETQGDPQFGVYGEGRTEGRVSATFQHSFADMSQRERSVREEHLSFHSNGAMELQGTQQRRSRSRVSSLIRAFNSDGYRDGGGTDGPLRDWNSETSWDKSALMSIQRELSEFSTAYHQSFNSGGFLSADPFSSRDNLYSSEVAAAMGHMGSSSFMRSHHSQHSLSTQLNSHSNFFMHSELSPFRVWRDHNRFPFRHGHVSGYVPHSEFPKWYETPMYKELSLGPPSQVPFMYQERGFRPHRKALQSVAPPPPPRSTSTSTVMQRASALEKRCESELAGHWPPWKRAQSLGANRLPPQRPSTVSPTIEMSRHALTSITDLTYKITMMTNEQSVTTETMARQDGVLQSNDSLTAVTVEQNVASSNTGTTPFNISQLLTPAIHSTQHETETSEVQQYSSSPPMVEHAPVRAESRGATPDVRMSSYKSRATSLLFNLKDNRKRVKSTYSPTKFKGLETTDKNKRASNQDSNEPPRDIVIDIPEFPDTLVPQVAVHEEPSLVDATLHPHLQGHHSPAQPFTAYTSQHTAAHIGQSTEYTSGNYLTPQMQGEMAYHAGFSGFAPGHNYTSKDQLANGQNTQRELSPFTQFRLGETGKTETLTGDVYRQASVNKPGVSNTLATAIPPLPKPNLSPRPPYSTTDTPRVHVDSANPNREYLITKDTTAQNPYELTGTGYTKANRYEQVTENKYGYSDVSSQDWRQQAYVNNTSSRETETLSPNDRLQPVRPPWKGEIAALIERDKLSSQRAAMMKHDIHSPRDKYGGEKWNTNKEQEKRDLKRSSADDLSSLPRPYHASADHNPSNQPQHYAPQHTDIVPKGKQQPGTVKETYTFQQHYGLNEGRQMQESYLAQNNLYGGTEPEYRKKQFYYDKDKYGVLTQQESVQRKDVPLLGENQLLRYQQNELEQHCDHSMQRNTLSSTEDQQYKEHGHTITNQIQDRRVEAKPDQARAAQIKTQHAQAELAKAQQAQKAGTVRIKAEQAEPEGIKVEHAEAERIKAEQAEAERIKVEQVEAERIKAEQAKAEQIRAEKAKIQQARVDRMKAEQAKTELAKIEKIKAQSAKSKAKQAATEVKVEPARVEQVKTELARAKAELAKIKEKMRGEQKDKVRYLVSGKEGDIANQDVSVKDKCTKNEESTEQGQTTQNYQQSEDSTISRYDRGVADRGSDEYDHVQEKYGVNSAISTNGSKVSLQDDSKSSAFVTDKSEEAVGDKKSDNESRLVSRTATVKPEERETNLSVKYDEVKENQYVYSETLKEFTLSSASDLPTNNSNTTNSETFSDKEKDDRVMNDNSEKYKFDDPRALKTKNDNHPFEISPPKDSDAAKPFPVERKPKSTEHSVTSSKDVHSSPFKALSHKERAQTKQEILTSKIKAHAEKEISAIREKGFAHNPKRHFTMGQSNNVRQKPPSQEVSKRHDTTVSNNITPKQHMEATGTHYTMEPERTESNAKSIDEDTKQRLKKEDPTGFKSPIKTKELGAVSLREQEGNHGDNSGKLKEGVKSKAATIIDLVNEKKEVDPSPNKAPVNKAEAAVVKVNKIEETQTPNEAENKTEATSEDSTASLKLVLGQSEGTMEDENVKIMGIRVIVRERRPSESHEQVDNVQDEAPGKERENTKSGPIDTHKYHPGSGSETQPLLLKQGIITRKAKDYTSKNLNENAAKSNTEGAAKYDMSSKNSNRDGERAPLLVERRQDTASREENLHNRNRAPLNSLAGNESRHIAAVSQQHTEQHGAENSRAGEDVHIDGIAIRIVPGIIEQDSHKITENHPAIKSPRVATDENKLVPLPSPDGKTNTSKDKDRAKLFTPASKDSLEARYMSPSVRQGAHSLRVSDQHNSGTATSENKQVENGKPENAKRGGDTAGEMKRQTTTTTTTDGDYFQLQGAIETSHEQYNDNVNDGGMSDVVPQSQERQSLNQSHSAGRAEGLGSPGPTVGGEVLQTDKTSISEDPELSREPKSVRNADTNKTVNSGMKEEQVSKQSNVPTERQSDMSAKRDVGQDIHCRKHDSANQSYLLAKERHQAKMLHSMKDNAVQQNVDHEAEEKPKPKEKASTIPDISAIADYARLKVIASEDNEDAMQEPPPSKKEDFFPRIGTRHSRRPVFTAETQDAPGKETTLAKEPEVNAKVSKEPKTLVLSSMEQEQKRTGLFRLGDKEQNTKPTPEQNTKPTPEQNTKPTPEQNTKPTPEHLTIPAGKEKNLSAAEPQGAKPEGTQSVLQQHHPPVPASSSASSANSKTRNTSLSQHLLDQHMHPIHVERPREHLLSPKPEGMPHVDKMAHPQLRLQPLYDMEERRAVQQEEERRAKQRVEERAAKIEKERRERQRGEERQAAQHEEEKRAKQREEERKAEEERRLKQIEEEKAARKEEERRAREREERAAKIEEERREKQRQEERMAAERRAKQIEEERAAKIAEERRLKQIEEEKRAKQLEEERRLKQIEEEKRAKQLEERRLKQIEEEKRAKQLEEERRLKQIEEEKRAKQLEERRLKQIEEEKRAKQLEERRLKQIEEEKRAKQLEEKRLKQIEEEKRAKQLEEERRLKQIEEEKRAKQLEERRLKQIEEEKRAKQLEERRLKQIEEENRAKQLEERRLKQIEEEKRAKQLEEERRLKQIEEEKRAKQLEERRLKQIEEEKRAKQLEERRLKQIEEEKRAKQLEERRLKQIEEEKRAKQLEERRLKQIEEEKRAKQLEERRLKQIEEEKKAKQLEEERRLKQIEEEKRAKQLEERRLKQIEEEKRAKQLEERRLKQIEEEKRAKQLEEKRLKQIEEEKRAKQLEEEKRLKQIEEEKRAKQLEEKRLKQIEEEKRAKQLEEERRLKQIEEEKRAKQLEERRLKQIEEEKRAKQLEERRLKQIEEEKRAKQLEEERRLKQIEEEKRAKQLEERRLKQIEEEKRAKQLEEERRLKQIEEEKRAKQLEEERRLKQIEEEKRAKQLEERRLKQIEEEKRAKQLEERRLKQIEEEKRAKQLEEKRLKQIEEEKRAKQLEEKRLKQIEEEKRAKQLEEERRLKQIEEENRAKQLEEERAAKIAEERRLKQIEEERRIQLIEEENRAKHLEEERRSAQIEEERRAAQIEEKRAAKIAEERRVKQIEAEKKERLREERIAAQRKEEEMEEKLQEEERRAAQKEEERAKQREEEQKAKQLRQIEEEQRAMQKEEERRAAQEKLAAQREEEEKTAKQREEEKLAAQREEEKAAQREEQRRAAQKMDALQYYAISSTEGERRPRDRPLRSPLPSPRRVDLSVVEPAEDWGSHSRPQAPASPALSLPRSNTSSPALGAKPTMFRVKDNTFRGSPFAKSIKPRFHKSLGEDFRADSPLEGSRWSEEEQDKMRRGAGTPVYGDAAVGSHRPPSSLQPASSAPLSEHRPYSRRSMALDEDDSRSVASAKSEDVESFATSASDLADIRGLHDYDRPESACSFSSDAGRAMGKPPSVPPKSDKALRRAKRLTTRRIKKELTKGPVDSPALEERPRSSSLTDLRCSDQPAFASPHFSSPISLAHAPPTPSNVPSSTTEMPPSHRSFHATPHATAPVATPHATAPVSTPHHTAPVALPNAPRTVASVPSSPTHHHANRQAPVTQYRVEPSYAPSYPMTQRKVLQDPGSGQYFVVDMPVQVKTKTFFDPETGKYVQLNVRQSAQGGSLPKPQPPYAQPQLQAQPQPKPQPSSAAQPYVLYQGYQGYHQGYQPVAVSSLPPHRSSSVPPAVPQETQPGRARPIYGYQENERGQDSRNHSPEQTPYMDTAHDTRKTRDANTAYNTHATRPAQLEGDSVSKNENSVGSSSQERDIIPMGELEDFMDVYDW